MHTIKQRSKNAMHWDSPCSFYHFQQRRGKATEDAVMVAEGQQPISEFWFNLNVLRCFFCVCVLFVLDNHHMITTFFFFSILYQYWISTTRVVGQFSEQLILDLYCKISVSHRRLQLESFWFSVSTTCFQWTLCD